MALSILSCVNAEDGKSVTATLSGAPHGALTWNASRIPGVAGTAVTATGSGAGPYTVALRSVATQTRMPYYVTATDSDGASSAVCEWVCVEVNSDWVKQLRDGLQEILLDNAPALVRALQIYLGGPSFPNGQPADVPKILQGVPYAQNDGIYPVVSVRVPRRTLAWETVPAGARATVNASITCYIMSQGDDAPAENAVGALGAAAVDVLDQQHYLEFSLPCGLLIQTADDTPHCQGYDTQEQWDEGIGMNVAVATIEWVGTVFYALET